MGSLLFVGVWAGGVGLPHHFHPFGRVPSHSSRLSAEHKGCRYCHAIEKETSKNKALRTNNCLIVDMAGVYIERGFTKILTEMRYTWSTLVVQVYDNTQCPELAIIYHAVMETMPNFTVALLSLLQPRLNT